MLFRSDNIVKSQFVEMFQSGNYPKEELGKLCDVRDGTHDSPKYLEESGYKFITSKNIINNEIDFSEVKYISKQDYDKFNIIGRTRDDAAGEAFDKVARSIGLGYPGGPKIDKAAKLGNPDAITFPKAKMSDNPYDFSFSGLKSAVLNYLNHAKMTGEEVNPNDLAASFQKAVVQVLVEHAIRGTKEHGFRKLALAGGVASNSALRASLKEACEKNGITLYYPSPIFCTDNAAMIGAAGYYEYKKGRRSGWDLNAAASLKLGER